MDSLLNNLMEVVAKVAIDVNAQEESESFVVGFTRYLTSVQPYINTYEHHLGHEITEEELRDRYKYEVALLYVLTCAMAKSSVLDFDYWPVSANSSPYAWYRPKEWSDYGLVSLIEELGKQSIPSLYISQIGGLLLDKASKRYLGEFYTPIIIAQHLVELAKIPRSEIFENKSLIDPACGGGIILGSVVNQVLALAVEQGEDLTVVIQNLSKNIHGFDIQPFAVILTRSILIHCALLYVKDQSFDVDTSLFSNIKLQDALVTYDKYWDDDKTPLFNAVKTKFDYVIGNPPFMSAKKRLLPYLDHYRDILSGHPNLYQLFLWWAVKSAKKGGVVSFLIPQSILSGHYFRDLRENLEQYSTIESITRITSATGVVGKANLQMMALCLQVSLPSSSVPETIKIRTAFNGDSLSLAQPYEAKYLDVLKKFTGHPVIWIVSDNSIDYEICAKVESLCTRLEQMRSHFSAGNGAFVWNEHKELLQNNQISGSIPLLSAGAISRYQIKFPYNGSHKSSERSYALLDEVTVGKVHSGRRVLIQRTTARKSGRRLISGMLSEAFLKQYPKFFLENHVNYIKSTNDNLTDLYSLVGWINSDVVNFFFQLRNGTSFVSVYDLLLLPINLQIMHPIVQIVKPLVEEQDVPQFTEKEDQINNHIYEKLEMTAKHISRIYHVLKAKGNTNES